MEMQVAQPTRMVARLLTLVKQDTILLVTLSVCVWMMGDGLDQCQFVKVHLFQFSFFACSLIFVNISFCDIKGAFSSLQDFLPS